MVSFSGVPRVIRSGLDALSKQPRQEQTLSVFSQDKLWGGERNIGAEHAVGSAPHDGVNRGWLRAPIDLAFATDQRTVGAAAEAIDADEVVEGGEPDKGSDQASSGACAAGDRGEGGERRVLRRDWRCCREQAGSGIERGSRSR